MEVYDAGKAEPTPNFCPSSPSGHTILSNGLCAGCGWGYQNKKEIIPNKSNDANQAKDVERKRSGSPTFYNLLKSMANIHDKKSHDYASNDNPFGNYHFSGMLSKLFNNPDDAGFISRIGEKLYRLANIENAGKTAMNETVDDTEIDICTITVLWMASRRERRSNANITNVGEVSAPTESQDASCKIIVLAEKLSMDGLRDMQSYLREVEVMRTKSFSK